MGGTPFANRAGTFNLMGPGIYISRSLSPRDLRNRQKLSWKANNLTELKITTWSCSGCWHMKSPGHHKYYNNPSCGWGTGQLGNFGPNSSWSWSTDYLDNIGGFINCWGTCSFVPSKNVWHAYGHSSWYWCNYNHQVIRPKPPLIWLNAGKEMTAACGVWQEIQLWLKTIELRGVYLGKPW